MRVLCCSFRGSLFLAGSLLTGLLLTSDVLRAATWLVDSTLDVSDGGTVCSSTPTGTCTLRAAIDAASSGDRIEFAPLTFGTFTLDSELLIDQQLTISGLPGEGIRLSGGLSNRIFRITASGTVLEDLTILEGTADEGGGVLMEGTASGTLRRLTFRDNRATGSNGGGGALAVRSTQFVDIYDSLFEDNTAISGASGGALWLDSTSGVFVSGCAFRGNTAAGDGGAVFISGPSAVENSHLAHNRSVGPGGALAVDGASFAVVFFSSFAHNGRLAPPPPVDAPGLRGAPPTTETETWVGGGGALQLAHSVFETAPSSTAGCVAESGASLTYTNMLSDDGSCAGSADSLPVQPTGLMPVWTDVAGRPPILNLPLESPAVDSATVCLSVLGNALSIDSSAMGRPVDGDGDGIAQCDLGALEGQWFFASGFESGGTDGWDSTVP